MSKRKPISKKIRFEVFKRDSFTCQYCGKKAPDVVLQIDHINPVASGGNNEITNLLTSCFDCNSGKSDRKLSDDSVVKKQQRQLELLQEKREQIKMMSDWQLSLSRLELDKVDEVVKYIEEKMDNQFSVNENGKLKIKKYMKGAELSIIYECIDKSAFAYLKFKDDKITKESAEIFLSKIPAIIKISLQPPIQQKIVKVLSFGKNTFNYWNKIEVKNLLNNYADALESKGWTEDSIANDIESEIIGLLNNSSGYNKFIGQICEWIDDIKKWESPKKEIVENKKNSNYKFSDESIKKDSELIISNNEMRIESLKIVSTLFPTFRLKPFIEELYLTITSFVYEQEKVYEQMPKDDIVEDDYDFIESFLQRYEIANYFNENSKYETFMLVEKCIEIIKDILTEIYVPRSVNFERYQQELQLKHFTEYYSAKVNDIIPHS